MGQNSKPTRIEAFITVFVPGLVFLVVVAFAYMAWKPVKGVARVASLPGVTPHEKVKPPSQVPMATPLVTPSMQASAPPKNHVSGGATQPAPINPTTTLPTTNETSPTDSGDNPAAAGDEADKPSPTNNSGTSTGN